MKKIIWGACALMALAVASCGKCDADKGSCAANDSISVAYGDFAGGMMQNEFSQYAGSEKALRNDFIRGFQLVFSQKADRNERIGMQVALNMLSELEQLEQQLANETDVKRADEQLKLLEIEIQERQISQQARTLKVELRDAAVKYVQLAHLQYRGGTLNYIDVLDAQRRYFDAQIGVSNAIRDEYLALINLYKVLGGGWSTDDSAAI